MSASDDSFLPPTSAINLDGSGELPSDDPMESTVVRQRTFPTFSVLSPEQRVVDRYRVVGLLGQGSMGEVYEVEDLLLDERVALKVLRPDAAQDPLSVKRFLREIRLARRISHPNVCRLLDTGVDRASEKGAQRDLYFFTMELLQGETLARRTQRGGRLTPEEALPLLRQLADGLGAAHSVGVVHRDLKTENVLLVRAESSRAWRVVVMDFGLARNIRPGEWTSITRGFLGTPAYMAPEQVEGRDVTPAADVYALGVVMFEMLTGVLPFYSENPLDTARMRLTHAPPSPRSLVPELDSRWEALILRCLERDPARRFASATQVRDALPLPIDPSGAGNAMVPWSEDMPGAWEMDLLSSAASGNTPQPDTTELPWPDLPPIPPTLGPRDSISVVPADPGQRPTKQEPGVD